MKRLLVVIPLLLVVVSCGSENEEDRKDVDLDNAHEKYDDGVFLSGSLTAIWHLEEYMYEDEELDEDKLFMFTDEYIMDEDRFDEFNEYEEGLAMKTSTMISKGLGGKYEGNEELFEEDLEEYRDILENGDDMFIDD